MIGKLRGRIDEIADGALILDVGGVGYLVEVPALTAAQLRLGAEATLQIETLVRADAIRLFGFATADEKAWFRLLQDVQGVGAKIALALLSALTISELLAAIAAQDAAALARAHGVGAKLAKRIVSELKDRAPAASILVRPLAGAGATPPQAIARADAISALVNLGYAQAQAMSAVDKSLAHLGEQASVEDLIREGLRAIG
jgi:Holliday junction DNA helicase RuvA